MHDVVVILVVARVEKPVRINEYFVSNLDLENNSTINLDINMLQHISDLMSLDTDIFPQSPVLSICHILLLRVK